MRVSISFVFQRDNSPPREKRHLLNREETSPSNRLLFTACCFYLEAAFLLYFFRLALALSLGDFLDDSPKKKTLSFPFCS